MKDIHRVRRLRLPRRRHQLTKLDDDNDDDDASDFEHEIFQKKSIPQTNKNANRMATKVFDTISISTLPIKEKQHQPLQISSDQSSLFLYSINSIKKFSISSDNLTSLTRTTTNTTPLTTLTYSNTKGTVKIDLTDLSGTDTLDSSPTNSDHDQSLSFNRKISIANINHKMKTIKDLTQIYDTDTSMKSVTFSKDNSLEHERTYQKHASCCIIPNVDCMKIVSPSLIPVTNYQRSSFRWNLHNMTNKNESFNWLFIIKFNCRNSSPCIHSITRQNYVKSISKYAFPKCNVSKIFPEQL